MKITGLRSFMSRDGNRPRVIVAVDTDEGITGCDSRTSHRKKRKSFVPASCSSPSAVMRTARGDAAASCRGNPAAEGIVHRMVPSITW